MRKFVRGEGREKDLGRSGIRGAITFYRKGQPKVAAFLEKVLKHG